MSNYNYSFKQYCLDNNRLDLLDRWDYIKNNKSPEETSYKTTRKIFFNCEKGKHESESYRLSDITNGKIKNVSCRKCKSFAQYIIDNYGEEYLYIIWNKTNELDPWKIGAGSNKRIIFNCVKDGTHIFTLSADHYRTAKEPCTICSGRKMVPKASAIELNKRLDELWSSKNIDKPSDYSLQASHKAWWKCENGIHEDYQRTMGGAYNCEYLCPKCILEDSGAAKRKDLTGRQFGELTVLYINEEKTKLNKEAFWVCKCSCGENKIVKASALLNNSIVTCGNKSIHYLGEHNGNWKGGVTPESLCARTSKEYIDWRDQVYSKDWYTCQCCGKYKNIEKNAHHIYNFSDNIDERYNINNGICLCKECHYSTEKGSFHNIYGTMNNTEEQLEEYINNKRKLMGIKIPFSIKEYQKGYIIKPHDFDEFIKGEII